jgi:hypothetical protein
MQDYVIVVKVQNRHTDSFIEHSDSRVPVGMFKIIKLLFI